MGDGMSSIGVVLRGAPKGTLVTKTVMGVYLPFALEIHHEGFCSCRRGNHFSFCPRHSLKV